MSYDVIIKSLDSDNVTRFNGVSLSFLQNWLEKKSYSLDNNTVNGTKNNSKRNGNKRQVKQNI